MLTCVTLWVWSMGNIRVNMESYFNVCNMVGVVIGI